MSLEELKSAYPSIADLLIRYAQGLLNNRKAAHRLSRRTLDVKELE